MAETKSVLMSGGVVIAIITGFSGLGKAWIQGKSSNEDMKDSYKVLASAVNDMQYRLGKVEGICEARSEAVTEGTSKKHVKVFKMDEIEVAGSVTAAPVASIAAVAVPSPTPLPGVAVDAGINFMARMKAEANKIPASLDEALLKEREGK